jgi:hypothetical protein
MKSFVSEDHQLVLLMNELLMVSNMALAFLRKVANGRQRNTMVFPSFPKEYVLIVRRNASYISSYFVETVAMQICKKYDFAPCYF